jgi:hypothetical protein
LTELDIIWRAGNLQPVLREFLAEAQRSGAWARRQNDRRGAPH